MVREESIDLADAQFASFLAKVTTKQKEQLELPVSNPYELVASRYTLPFSLYQFQQRIVNDLGPLARAGYYMDVGTGKTATATASALYKFAVDDIDKAVVLMPPILLDGWYRYLTQIKEISATIYRGTPAQRRDARFDADFILLGYQIFKKDYDRIMDELGSKRLFVIADEAQDLKNVSSQNHKTFRDFTAEQQIALLSGTPVSVPMDGYAFCKLVAPSLYKSRAQFERIHVGERDFFGKVTRWQNLDLLKENMKVNSARVLKEEVLHELPAITYTPLYYQLDPAHQKLYTRLADEQLLELEAGGKIDATQESALYHALQQIVVNLDHFSGNPGARSAAFDIIDQVIEELDGRKLVLFANYRLTNRKLAEYLRKHNGVSAYGDQNVTQNRAAIDRFISDPTVKVINVQPTSGGVGVDGLQHVCCDAFFVETPTVPRWFHQAAARLHRSGQKLPVNVRIGIAERTCQVRLHKNLLANDSLVNTVVPGPQDLRDAIYGK